MMPRSFKAEQQGLKTEPEPSLEQQQFFRLDEGAPVADLAPEHICRCKQRSAETKGRSFLVDVIRHFQCQVAQLMSKIQPLPPPRNAHS